MIFFLPVIAILCETLGGKAVFTIGLVGKWFVFSASGLRLFIAGIKQVIDPGFTTTEIFKITDTSGFPIVRELGFANICFGTLGIISLFMPEWRVPAAFCSGMYYAFAAFVHIFKKSRSANENFALITDIYVFAVLAVYFVALI